MRAPSPTAWPVERPRGAAPSSRADRSAASRGRAWCHGSACRGRSWPGAGSRSAPRRA